VTQKGKGKKGSNEGSDEQREKNVLLQLWMLVEAFQLRYQLETKGSLMIDAEDRRLSPTPLLRAERPSLPDGKGLKVHAGYLRTEKQKHSKGRARRRSAPGLELGARLEPSNSNQGQ